MSSPCPKWPRAIAPLDPWWVYNLADLHQLINGGVPRKPTNPACPRKLALLRVGNAVQPRKPRREACPRKPMYATGEERVKNAGRPHRIKNGVGPHVVQVEVGRHWTRNAFRLHLM